MKVADGKCCFCGKNGIADPVPLVERESQRLSEKSNVRNSKRSGSTSSWTIWLIFKMVVRGNVGTITDL